jgi:predicted RNA-binding Zn-ribbon protein involved in translation (DUF1610 family)
MKKKKPRFFCDGCGTEVAANAERCPHCGKFFASIRCPKCGFTGDTDTFGKGCPVCGYSAPLSNRPVRRPAKPARHTAAHDSAAAPWPYALSIILLAMLLAALFMHITR